MPEDVRQAVKAWNEGLNPEENKYEYHPYLINKQKRSI